MERTITNCKLEYLIHETEHLCPIVCASWMVMHITLGDNFLILHDDKKPYFGFPILISVLPKNGKTKIILGRFRVDTGSELIFNQFRNLQTDKEDFEKELSRLIVENVENFYLSPSFWDKLNEEEKEVILNAITTDKKKIPEKRTEFEIINFFDQKYKLV